MNKNRNKMKKNKMIKFWYQQLALFCLDFEETREKKRRHQISHLSDSTIIEIARKT